MADKSLKVVLFCRSLNRGGAERQIIYLARGLQQAGHQVIILCLYPPSPDWYDTAGLTVVHLGKKSRWDIIGFLRSYIRFIKVNSPDILYSFLTVQNIIAAITSLFTRTRIICGVRVSFMDFDQYSYADKFLSWLEYQLYRLNVKVICNSYAGRQFVSKCAPYASIKISVVTNGLDFSLNKFSEEERQQFRSKLGLTEDDILVGHVGRYDPMKDHKTFIDAAAIVLGKQSNCQFLCWGHGDPAYSQTLKDYAKSQGINIIWHSENANPCYSAFDLYCLTSIGEGYSNTLCEAMAHGIPCITTDVGDCRRIVGHFGDVVAPSNAHELALAIFENIRKKTTLPNEGQVEYSEKIFSINQLITNTLKEFN